MVTGKHNTIIVFSVVIGKAVTSNGMYCQKATLCKREQLRQNRVRSVLKAVFKN